MSETGVPVTAIEIKPYLLHSETYGQDMLRYKGILHVDGNRAACFSRGCTR
jgi:hypothetical protein